MKTVLSLSIAACAACLMLTACDNSGGTSDRSADVKPPPAEPIKSPTTERTLGKDPNAQPPPPAPEGE